MAIVFFDSRAFVKLLVEEDGSDLAAALWDGCETAVSSRLADPEVRAALAASGRADRLHPKALHTAKNSGAEFWSVTTTSSPPRARSTHEARPALR